MRIVYLSNSVVPSRDADSVQVMRMCDAFAGLGHDVHLFARGSRSSEEEILEQYGVASSFTISRYSLRKTGHGAQFFYAVAVYLSRPLKKRPDVIYGRHLLSMAMSAGNKTPFIYEVHASPNRKDVRVERSLFSRGNLKRVVAISSALVTEYKRIHPALTNEEFIVAPDAACDPEHGKATSLELRTDPTRMQVGYSGHLYPGRGIELLLELARCRPEMDFHFVGGEDADIDCWRRRAGDINNVHFHGHVNHSFVPAYLSKFDVLVAPYQERVSGAGGGETSRWMSPMKIFEYMAAGKPMLVSDMPVLREVLCDRENALLVPCADIDSWVAAIDTMADPRIRARIGECARRDFLQKHTWKRRAEHVLKDTLTGK